MTDYVPNDWADFVSGTPSAAQIANAAKLNRIEAALVDAFAQLKGTTTGEASKLLALDDAGRAAGEAAVADNQFTNLGQVLALIASGGLVTKDVKQYVLGSQPSVSGTTPIDVPDLVKTDARTGDLLRVDYALKHRGDAGGISYSFKGNTSGPTNKDPNPSYETDISGYSATGLTDLSQATTGGAADGTSYLRAVITGAQTSQQIWTDWVPLDSTPSWSAGVFCRRASGSPRTVRADLQYKNDATGDLLGGTLGGAGVTPGTGGWTQAVVDDTHGGPTSVPSGATHVRRRIAILNVQAGDEFHFDKAQLEPTGTLPAFGSTGGSGSGALAIDGTWYGLKTSGTSDDDYTRHQSIRTPDVAGVTATFGALATDTDTTGSFLILVTGSGLTDQVVGLQFAKRTTSGSSVATQLMSGSVTIAKLAVAA